MLNENYIVNCASVYNVGGGFFFSFSMLTSRVNYNIFTPLFSVLIVHRSDSRLRSGRTKSVLSLFSLCNLSSWAFRLIVFARRPKEEARWIVFVFVTVLSCDREEKTLACGPGRGHFSPTSRANEKSKSFSCGSEEPWKLCDEKWFIGWRFERKIGHFVGGIFSSDKKVKWKERKKGSRTPSRVERAKRVNKFYAQL